MLNMVYYSDYRLFELICKSVGKLAITSASTKATIQQKV